MGNRLRLCARADEEKPMAAEIHSNGGAISQTGKRTRTIAGKERENVNRPAVLSNGKAGQGRRQ